jgi:hypothetical protein
MARPPLSWPSSGDPALPSPLLALIHPSHRLLNVGAYFGVSPGLALGSISSDRVMHVELVEFQDSTAGPKVESRNTSSPVKSTFC